MTLPNRSLYVYGPYFQPLWKVSEFLKRVVSYSDFMGEKSGNGKLNKYITIVLAIAIIAAIGVYAYTNLIKKEPAKSDDNTPPIIEPKDTLLTITVGSQLYNYTLDDLTSIDDISEQGSYINKVGKITGPNNYTGITVSMLLNTIPSLPTNYTFHAIASDDYARNYSINELNGHVTIFNETGAEIGTGNLTMIIAYKENGVLLNETTKGPLRIAFVDTEPSITNSGLWLSSLAKIEIIE